MNLPEGWPTPEMIEAAKDARLAIPEETLPGKVFRIIFEAMLAAAPTPPAVEPDGYISPSIGNTWTYEQAHAMLPQEVIWTLTPFYTHPAPPSELVKAAEYAHRRFELLALDDEDRKALSDLRAALDKTK